MPMKQSPGNVIVPQHLILYYAEAGEALWDIARLYCTSMEAIQRENGLECEKMDSKGMLLIPMQAN